MTIYCNKSHANVASLALPFSPVGLIEPKQSNTTAVNVKAKIAIEWSKGE